MPPPAHTPDAQRLKSPPPPPPPLPHHLSQLLDSLFRRFADLEEVQNPQLAEFRGPLSFHDELAAGVRAELAGCKRDLEEFKLEVDDLEKARDRLAAAEHVKAVQQRLDSCTRLYRQAVVTSKRQIDAFSHLSARDELLGGQSGQGNGGRESPSPYGSARGGISRARSPAGGQTSDDALMSATSDVTEGLRRTLQLMQSEVDRSLVSNELLQSQTQTMQLTTDEYSTLSSLMSTSKNLITSLERADVLDRLLLFFAFSFFAAVCAHIFKKRVIDKGVRVAGALGSIAARGGSLVGGVAGVGKHVEQAREIGHHGAREVVRSEIVEEVAKAAATATAVVGAIRAGVTNLAGRALQKEEHVFERAPAAAPFEDVAPPREEEEVQQAAPVAEHSESVEQDHEEEEEAYEDASASPLIDDASSPSPAEEEEEEALPPIPAHPIDSLSDSPPPASSSTDPLPSASTTAVSSSPYSTPSSTPPFPDPVAPPSPASPPAAATSQLPLDSAPAPEEAQGIFQPGEPDLHRVVPPPLPTDAEPVKEAHATMPPVAGEGLPEELEEVEDAQPVEEEEQMMGLADDAERVELRQQNPPSPTKADLPVFEDLAEETPAVLPDEKPDLLEEVEHEHEEAVEAEQQREGEQEEEEKVFQPLKSLRPTRPDLDEQLGDIEQIVEENRVEPPVDFPPPLNDELSIPITDSLPESTTMPTPPSSSPDGDSPFSPEFPTEEQKQEEVPIAVNDPTLLDSYASTPPGIVDAAAEADIPREVAGPEGTTIPLSSSSSASPDEVVEEGVVPPLDVQEDGEVPAAVPIEGEEAEEVVEKETTLPIDLDAEQTLWTDSSAAVAAAEEVHQHGWEEEQEALDLDLDLDPSNKAVEVEHALPPSPAHEEAEGEEEREMLEEMMERQFGGGAYGSGSGGVVGNVTQFEDDLAPFEEEGAPIEEEEPIEAEEPLQAEPVELQEGEVEAGEREEEESVTEQEAEVEEAAESASLADAEEVAGQTIAIEEQTSLAAEPVTIPVATLQPTPVPSPSTEDLPPPFTTPTAEPLTTPIDAGASTPTPAAPEAEAEPTPTVVFSSISSPPIPVETAYQHETTPEPEYLSPPVADKAEEPPHATSSTASLEEETAPVPVPTDATEVVVEEPYEDVAEALAGLTETFVSEVVMEEEEPVSASAVPPVEDVVPQPNATPSTPDEVAPEPTPPSTPRAAAVNEPIDLPLLDDDEELLSSPDADVPNSDALYPDASVEETPSDLEADYPSHALSDDETAGEEGVFASAADEAVASHLGEDDGAPAPGHQADEALQRAEERLVELEEEGGEEEEFDAAGHGVEEAEDAVRERVQRNEL